MTATAPASFDAIVIGAGAAGLLCALTAGRRGLRVLVVDHANKVGKKILMSGGGRCNFTNTGTTPANYLSANPHFCKSALARYRPGHFIAMVEAHGIAYHEKELGQLFCDVSSKLIVKMLVDECLAAGVRIETACSVASAASPGLPGAAWSSTAGSAARASAVAVHDSPLAVMPCTSRTSGASGPTPTRVKSCTTRSPPWQGICSVGTAGDPVAAWSVDPSAGCAGVWDGGVCVMPAP